MLQLYFEIETELTVKSPARSRGENSFAPFAHFRGQKNTNGCAMAL
jgi:hypothetical protein